jgi:hypothetical protein
LLNIITKTGHYLFQDSIAALPFLKYEFLEEPLNLDDLRTQVAQNRTRAGSGMKYAVFDNAYAA